MGKGRRLDVCLLENGLSESIEKAKKIIIAGWVKVNGETVHTPSKIISCTERIVVERPSGIFVSRGGEKLQHALDHFGISVKERVVADLGSSTGGFTDCLLKNGVCKVYAIDVGYGQLDYRLRNDDKVVVLERTNVRNIEKKHFNDIIDFVTADLSFISIIKVFSSIRDNISPDDGIILIKPQFEAKSYEHNNGVVRDKEDHSKILKRVLTSLFDKGAVFRGLTYSPIKGPAGNIEFLFYFSIGLYDQFEEYNNDIELIIDCVVEESHRILNNS
ncbi:MAG: TlyA family RNA methyltransferase [Spirochaetota bacterium]|nr:TlyA family RNA methyltransferase [Spirochaetota bacterium]